VHEHKRGGSIIAVSARQKTNPRRPTTSLVLVTVSQASFSVPAGSAQTVLLNLNGVGSRLLARFRNLPVRVGVTGIGSTPAVMLMLPHLRVNVSTPPDKWFHLDLPCSDCYTIAQSVPITGIPTGADVSVICYGGGCPFTRRSVRPRAGRINVASLLGSSHLQPGAQVQVVITARRRTGEVLLYTMQRGSPPVKTTSARA
jgi:hypothetical protein